MPHPLSTFDLAPAAQLNAARAKRSRDPRKNAGASLITMPEKVRMQTTDSADNEGKNTSPSSSWKIAGTGAWRTGGDVSERVRGQTSHISGS